MKCFASGSRPNIIRELKFIEPWVSHVRERRIWFELIFPGFLLAAAILLVIIPTDALFLVGSAVGSITALVAPYIFVVKLRDIRLCWVASDGLLLGYSLGTLNTALRLALSGSETVATHFSRPQEQLSDALAASLAASAMLFFLGSLLEKPVLINQEYLRRGDSIILFVGLATVVYSYAIGAIGFEGSQVSEGHHLSIMSDFGALWSTIIPPLIICFSPRFQSSECRALGWVLFIVSLALLVPMGRRYLIYTLLICFITFALQRRKEPVRLRRLLLLGVIALPLLYFGNRAFYAMRRSSWENKSARSSLTGLVKGAAELLTSDHHSQFDNELSENLQDRTFILRYFSDVLNATWTHQPLYGRDLLFSVELAIPSALYPNKAEVLEIGAEESLVNPELGLEVVDEANSVLTAGASDFGIAGVFIYPIVLILLISYLVRVSRRFNPPIVNIVVTTSLLTILWQAEYPISGWMAACRDLALLSGVLTAVVKFQRFVMPRVARRELSLSAALLDAAPRSPAPGA